MDCIICDAPRGEHKVGSLACPVFASFDPEYLAGFHYELRFTPPRPTPKLDRLMSRIYPFEN